MATLSIRPDSYRDNRIYERLTQLSSSSRPYTELVDTYVSCATPIVDSVISGPFKQFTLHNRDHCAKLIHIVSSIVSDDTLRRFSVADCILIIYSCYLHDMGMALPEADRRSITSSSEFSEFTKGQKDISSRLEYLRELTPSDPTEVLNRDYEIFQLQEALLCAFLRPLHATRDRYQYFINLLKKHSGRNDLFMINNQSFEDDLIEICISHNLGAECLLDRHPLDRLEDRYPLVKHFPGGITLNARFCAAALRLADILDFDRERTPQFLFESFDIASRSIPGSETSLREWGKHLSIQSVVKLVDEVLIQSQCNHPTIHKAVIEFCKIIETEIRNTLLVYKKNAAADNNSYHFDLPTNVRHRIDPIGYRYVDMSLRLNQSAIMKILMGNQLYKNEYVCIRELIQNAVDAILARKRLHLHSNIEDSVAVNLYQAEDSRWYLSVTDNGIGMDEAVMDNYFFCAGNSYYTSSEFERLVDKSGASAERFNPISRFGIGVLSVFMIADALEVESQSAASPRGDSVRRKARVERLTGLAFVTDLPPSNSGTRIRILLKTGVARSTHSLQSAVANTFNELIVRPAIKVKYDDGKHSLIASPHNFYTLKPKYVNGTDVGGLRVFEIKSEQYSSFIEGPIFIVFNTTSSSPSESTKVTISKNRFDTRSLISGFGGNRVTINGFRIGMKKTPRVFKNKELSPKFYYDLNINDATNIKYDVARSRLLEGGSRLVKEEITQIVERAMTEDARFASFDKVAVATVSRKPLVAQHPDSTDEARSSAKHPIKATIAQLHAAYFDELQAMLPQGPWPRGFHRTVAEKLRLTNNQATKYLSWLLSTGLITKPPPGNGNP